MTKGFGEAGGFKANKYDDRIPRCLQMIRHLRSARMLDLGCGDGFFMEMARSLGIGSNRLVGIELNAAAADRARGRGFECFYVDAQSSLPFSDGSFDFVFAGEIIEHVADPDALLAEIHRVLCPGGWLLLTTPNLIAWFNRILVTIGITPMFVEHSYRVTYGPAYTLLRRAGKPVGHLRIFTWAPLRQLMRDHGFSIKRRSGSACLPVPVVHQLDRLVARLFPPLAANMLVLAQRGED